MTKDVGLFVQETTGERIVRQRLERGDILKDGLIYTKGGINK